VVRTSVFGWQTFPDLRLIYSRHVTTSCMGKVSAMSITHKVPLQLQYVALNDCHIAFAICITYLLTYLTSLRNTGVCARAQRPTSSSEIFPVDRRVSLFLRARIAEDFCEGSTSFSTANQTKYCEPYTLLASQQSGWSDHGKHFVTVLKQTFFKVHFVCFKMTKNTTFFKEVQL